MSRLKGLDPKEIGHVLATADALEAGRIDEAVRAFEPLARSAPLHPEVLRLGAGIDVQRGRYREAIAAMRRAIAARPDDALYYNTLGSILGNAGEYDESIAALRRCCELQPTLASGWFNLGVMLTRSVRNAEAIDALREAVRHAPEHAAARALLADMLRVGDRAAEAEAEYRRILSITPYAGMAWWGLADLKTIRFNETDRAALERALVDPRASDDDRIAAGFAYAKALDDDGRHADSLAALERANAIALKRRQWDSDGFSAHRRAIEAAFTPPPVAAPGDLGAEAIFIVSLPRSGSTLIEQILASHSQVEGAGELPDLSLVLLEESRRRGAPFPRWVASMTAADWQRLGERYLERTAHWRSARAMFTDKLPGNWQFIGAIRAMLPGARIIGCRRDPLETCFSCYRQLLDNNEYTRRFESLAAFWREFDRTLQQWHARDPEHVREQVYERLVADPETEIRALLEFCRLPFEPACLEFHKTRRDVRSPSAMQVREPLRRDTARAERYGALLDPLRRALGSASWQPASRE